MRFGIRSAIIFIAAATMVGVGWSAPAAAQCQNVTIEIGTIVNGVVNNSGAPIIVSPGTSVGFFPITRLNGVVIPITAAQWWFTAQPLTANPNFPNPDRTLAISSSFNPLAAQIEPGNVATFRFADQGTYDIGVRVQRGTLGFCPPPAPNNTPVPVVYPEFVTVADAPTASFDAAILVRDQVSLVPLNDWAELFSFTMSFNPDQPAPRALTRLQYTLIPDPESGGENPYRDNGGGPLWHNIREFGLFIDRGIDGPDGVINTDPTDGIPDDELFLTWDAQGYPYELRVPGGPVNGRFLNDADYDLSFVFDARNPGFIPIGTNPLDPDGNNNPKFPRDEWVTAAPDPGTTYLVGVRLSSTWSSNQTMSVVVRGAQMQPISAFGGTAVESPNPDDGYPEFPVSEDVGYASSFEVFDVTGGRETNAYINQNLWNWPQFQYTPLGEFVRPRFDLAFPFDFVFGETMDIRDLFSVEEWVPLIGINAHAAFGVPREVNVVLTDIGGDPFGPPGNGGFDPRTGLETFTSVGTAIGGDGHFAIGSDFSFNGVWLYHDTNNNGQFDAPRPVGGNGPGVQFNATNAGDYPMLPATALIAPPLTVQSGLLEWEYVPFPPGGGDPWWKIRLLFGGDRRRGANDSGLSGQMEATPDPFDINTGYAPRADYFVVMRPDSGFRDVSGLQGDGNGIALGADTRAFIEPRRWNPRLPLVGRPDTFSGWDGGILLDPMFSNPEDFGPIADSNPADGVLDFPRWQDDPNWDIVCTQDAYPCETAPADNIVYPYWDERTSNRDTVKPVKVGLDVHDLVLTYSTDNLYAKETLINVGQRVGDAGDFGSAAYPFFMDPFIFDRDHISETPGPFGINQYRFFNLDIATIAPDVFFGTDDALTYIQYSYETVPFKLDGDAIDAQFNDPRSFYFPNPPQQPTLPRAQTWPPGNALVVQGSGLQSFVYLQSEGAIPNEPYNPPASSSSEASYADDVYVAVLQDGPAFANNSLTNSWFVDENGAKFRITGNTGNQVTLRRGHAAYVDRQFRLSGLDVNIPDYPFGVPVGVNNGVRRGAWLVVRDALPRNVYPQQSDWPEGLLSQNAGLRAARLLKQHVGPESRPTAMLGLNVAGTDDPIVNAAGVIGLNSVTVAFWGPNFTPSDLNQLDPAGALISSGVLLYEDTDGTGAFSGAIDDAIVPLEENSLRWRTAPEPIDLDGDNIADDMSGDGVVYLGGTPPADPNWDGLDDRAWVLRLQPRTRWTVPFRDIAPPGGAKSAGVGKALGPLGSMQPYAERPSYWNTTPFHVLADLSEPVVGKLANTGEKALTRTTNPGDDLFVVIRTSDSLGAFEQFRCVVPSRLPTRSPQSEQIAGVEMTPRAYAVAQSFDKSNPDEGAVQDFYGHDMMEAGIGARIVDLTSTLPQTGGVPVIQPGSPAAAILGIDVSANRPDNIAASGTSGTLQGTNRFTTGGTITVPSGSPYFVGGAWTAQAVGLYLMGLSQGAATASRYEAYEITAVNGTELTLRAGAPRNGSPWVVVRDPSFLEQVIVEFYDVNRDGRFDIQKDLAPLNIEGPLASQQSGVALYRDNDFHPNNTNGVFDPPVRDAAGNVIEYIDLPVDLDGPPTLIGTVGGEPELQVRFTFASPGTDNLKGRDTLAYEQQPRLRQWVPQTYGNAPSDKDFGPDFFVVVRTTRSMALGDDFFASIVSWGPSTPTEPDPDNFSVSLPGSPLPGQREDEFDLFSEFPWGSRALGFITFFKDPPPVYYWTIDRDTRRLKVRKELDRSQDDKTIRYWVRTNANVFGSSKVITASAPPEVDFVANPVRQIPGPACSTLSNPPANCGQIQFTLITTGDASSIVWDFGDGTTSTDRNPVKVYNTPGVYTVTVTVTDPFGVVDTETKINYIEIVNPPMANFSANPTDGIISPKLDGDCGLDVTFIDLSIGTNEFQPTSWFWNFGDGTTLTTSTRATAANPLVHRYTRQGFYTVTLETTFTNASTNQTQVSQFRRQNLINVRPPLPNTCGATGEGEGEGEGEGGAEAAAADFSAQSFIKDQEALLPLNDWVPLFEFTMGYSPDDPAPRVLQQLIFDLRPDPRGPDDLNYANIRGPQVSDLLEFGMFQQGFSDSDDDSTLNVENDTLLFTWDNLGLPLGSVTPTGNRLRYTLDFIGRGTPANPEFPVVAAANVDGGFEGNSYIVAVRTSATWRSQTTLGLELLRARMIIPPTGVFPTDDEGAPVDSYSPNFYDGETLAEDASYSASFGAFDITGGFVPTVAAGAESPFPGTLLNTWNHPTHPYFPLEELSRPRWNQFNRIMNLAGGELLQIRQLIGLDEYVPVIGLNLHSTQGEHFDGLSDRRGPRFADAAALREVNVILTDIGADPYGPAGNGGFDPRNGLERMVNGISSTSFEPASGSDFAFNGISVWYDTNGNGRFDPPTQTINGITFGGDRPMVPFSLDGSVAAWEWIPLPPGGGDPWWKISLKLAGVERTPSGEDDEVDGRVEKVPDNILPDEGAGASEVTLDYFVVIRTDSGYQDVSRLPGDGVGITAGADFRAFIEPRRFDAIRGVEAGGIYVDSQIPPWTPVQGPSGSYTRWQDDPQFTDVGLPSRWGAFEPWWPQRTLNASAAKPVKAGIDVHDLVLTYATNSPHAVSTDISFGAGPFSTTQCLTYAIGFDPTDFDRWVDPLGLVQSQFFNGHSIGVNRFSHLFDQNVNFGAFGTVGLTIEEGFQGQYAYETVPFFNPDPTNGDVPPGGPRSSALPFPPTRPSLPDYANWPKEIRPGEYPRASQWRSEHLGSRLLTQKTDINSSHVAMLGINVVGSNDLVVRDSNPVTIGKITVAFWGPNFTPSKLQPLDPNGTSLDSGVLLWEDADQTSTFLEASVVDTYLDAGTASLVFDRVVPLRNLAWPSAPEPIDLDGDGLADDMDGDGIVDNRDYAWVLEMTPQVNWTVPQTDFGQAFIYNIALSFCGSLAAAQKDARPANYVQSRAVLEADAKALNPALGQPGDDLFITVKTTDQMRRFEKFRAVVPATLPSRGTAATRKGGVQFFPQINTSTTAFLKSSPDEDPVQDFYGHDMLEINVPTKIADLANQSALITIGGAALPVLGIDVSTNQGSATGTPASGANGTGTDRRFTVAGAAWTANDFAGDFLIDSAFESYRILSNTANQLTLQSGTPRDGAWRIVRNPTFLEEITVEFYNVGQDADFNPLTDLLPLNIDQEASGVALYRDNDNHPQNRNGIFDPFIDIPLPLDCEPQFIGQTAEDLQVLFTFSTPGTDNVPLPIEQQTRHRQWVYDSWGNGAGDPASGADFFVVVRASGNMRAEDNFRVGIVSWGPNTPTEPDPDTFAVLPGEERNDAAKFREFPWAQRGLGYITFFKTPQTYYYLDGAKAGRRSDSSGFEWLRSSTTKKRRTGVITARTRPISPISVVIQSTSESVVPPVMLPGTSFDFVIRGSGFGTRPQVVVSGYTVEVRTATDTAISVRITTPNGVPAQDPIVLIVRNPDTGEEQSRADLLRTGEVALKAPKISSVSPNRGDQNSFPVVVRGTDFPDREHIQVIFGNTLMPVMSVAANGTSVTVGYPAGGFPTVGKLDVTVRALGDAPGAQARQDVLIGGFEYVARIKSPSFFGCAPPPAESATKGAGRGDAIVVLGVLAALAWAGRRARRSLHKETPAVRKNKSLPRIIVAMTVASALLAALPAAAFFPLGRYNEFRVLYLQKWPLAEFDLNGNGQVETNEGLEMIIEVGKSGFLPQEVAIVQDALAVWGNVPSSYARFKVTGYIQDPLLSGIEPDTIRTISMQVTAADDTGEEVDPDIADVVIADLAFPVVGITVTLFTVAEELLPIGGNVVQVGAGTILDSDIIISANATRANPPGTQPTVDLRSVMVHELGHLLGLGHTPLNNLRLAFGDPTTPTVGDLVENAIFALTDTQGIQRTIGVTPTMFPSIFYTLDDEGRRGPGADSLAPDDISAISWLYPRGSQANFFTINQEARSQVRAGSNLPSEPLPGAHIVAWADHDNNDATPRIAMFSTMAGLYQPFIDPALVGRFRLIGLWKQFELVGAPAGTFFNPTYTFTSNPLNFTGFERQAPPLAGPESFDSLQGAGLGGLERGTEDYTNNFPSEVFHETENILDISNRDAGTPMVWSHASNTLVSTLTGKSLATIRPADFPMFGDPNEVCPLNLLPAGSGGGTTPVTGTFGPDDLRRFRDGFLLRSAIGTAFVDAYYSIAPVLTRFLLAHDLAFRLFAAGVNTFYWIGENAMMLFCLASGLLLWQMRREIRRFSHVLMRLFLMAAIVLCVLPAGALSYYLTDQELAGNADAVVTGTVQTTQGRWAKGGRIYTDVVVEVNESVKGGLNKASQITITVIGGQIGGFVMTASEMPNFKEGDEAVLFLKQLPNGSFRIVAGQQGRIAINDNKGVKTVGNRDLSLFKALDAEKAATSGGDTAQDSTDDGHGHAAEEAGIVPLDEYLAYLREVVKEQAKAAQH